MKGKRYTTEDQIRILREADPGEKSTQDMRRDENLPVVRFHRRKKQFEGLTLILERGRNP